MQKLNKLFIVLAFIAFNNLQAQTTILDQTLLTQSSFDTFTPASVYGAQTWKFDSRYGAVCSGFSGGTDNENEDWLISPVMNLSATDNAQLTFSHTRGNVAVMNVGVSYGWYKAFATANYTGNPESTQWVELTGLNQNITTAWQFVSSGNLTIPAAAKSKTTRIAFRYISDPNQSATWEIKNVKVTTTTSGTTNPNTTATFKITNWNTEWLGCTTFGPTDETQQINNIATAMRSINADVYCIQEVVNTPSVPSIATIVSLLGSEWAGAIVPANTGDCNQRQGIIYKKARVQLVSSQELNSGQGAQGNSYYYNWTSGRYPALYNVNFISGNTKIPVSLINIHAKSEDNDIRSYNRRTGAAEGLKILLDEPNYNTKNVVVIGDFNDYLSGTTSSACNCTVSPYNNFTQDTSNYTGITKDITDVDTRYGIHPIIENIIISNELVANYVANSAAQETSVARTISNYYNTTSDHLPVSAQFQFTILDTPDVTYIENSWKLYPNPVKDVLNISSPESLNNAATEIFDITGRQILHGKLNNNTINVSSLPTGIYIVKIGNRSGRFIKE